MRGEGVEIEVTDTQKKADGLFLHEVRVISGTVSSPVRSSWQVDHAPVDHSRQSLRDPSGA
jgi:alanyl-tRNA synthetase